MLLVQCTTTMQSQLLICPGTIVHYSQNIFHGSQLCFRLQPKAAGNRVRDFQLRGSSAQLWHSLALDTLSIAD